ncbi:ribosomal protein L30e, partial [Kipferlia bialata]
PIGTSGFALVESFPDTSYDGRTTVTLYQFDRETRQYKLLMSHTGNLEHEDTPLWAKGHTDDHEYCFFSLHGCLYHLSMLYSNVSRLDPSTSEWYKIPFPSVLREDIYAEPVVAGYTSTSVYIEVEGKMYSYTPDDGEGEREGEEERDVWQCEGDIPDGVYAHDMLCVGPYLVCPSEGVGVGAVFDTQASHWYTGDSTLEALFADSKGGTYMTMGEVVKGGSASIVSPTLSIESYLGGLYAHVLMVDTLALQDRVYHSKQQLESLSLTLALVVKSGKYSMGFNQALKSIRANKAKLVLISNNTPALRRS